MSNIISSSNSYDSLYKIITGIKFSFGPVGSYVISDDFIFGDTGKIEGYEHENERFWNIKDNKIIIMNKDGVVTWESSDIIENNLNEIILHSKINNDTKFRISSKNIPTPDLLENTTIQENKEIKYHNDFLFPHDLEISETGISKVLLIGSCLTSLYFEGFSDLYKNIKFDYIPYNFISEIPESPPEPIDTYNFQYVQIPLRSVLSDKVIWGQIFLNDNTCSEILENGKEIIDAMLETAMAYNIKYNTLTFVSNFIVPQKNTAPSLDDAFGNRDLRWIVMNLNIYLNGKIKNFKNTYLADIDAIASSLGKEYILDDITYFYTHGGVIYQDWDDFGSIPRNEPIPDINSIYDIKREKFLRAAFRQVETAYRTIRQIDQVKAVVFDLDNTIWRGQIAENYRHDTQPWPRRDGWPMGLWEAVHYLRARGILVAICSKNDYEYVKERWSDVVDPHFVSLDDFASVKINWDPKAKNIEEICSEFNIKPKSVVFVDDNPVERAAVTSALPEIRAIGGNPYLTRRILLWSAETQIARMTDESGKREEMIKGQIQREGARKSMSREEFLQSLHCEVSFIEIETIDQKEFGRALELTNKTNQFNTTGKRWLFDEVSKFLSDGGRIFSFSVKDKFTEYGLVGVIYVKKNEIIQYVMSCRVLGMGVEEFAIEKIVSKLRSSGNTNIISNIIYTKDNTPCRNVYIQCGFNEIKHEENTKYFELSENKESKHVTHITEIN